MDSIQTLRTYLIALSAILAIFAALAGTALEINENAGSDAAFVSPGLITSTAKGHDETLPALMLKDALVLEEREGYNSEYIFGMTKGILNSTLITGALGVPDARSPDREMSVETMCSAPSM